MEEEITVKGTEWNLTPLFKSDDDPLIKEKRKVWEESVESFMQKWFENKTYLEDPVVLKEALDNFERLSFNYGASTDEYLGSSSDEVYYFWLKSQIDQNDPEIKARFNKVEEFSKSVENNLSFFTLNLGKVPEDKQHLFLNDPGLQKYHHFLERIFVESQYALSIEEEKIMNLKSPSSHGLWTQMTAGFIAKEEREVLDEDEKPVVKPFEGIVTLMSSTNKKVRDKAAQEMHAIVKKHSDVAEAELNAILYDKKVNDMLRGFERPDTARHVTDDINTEVVDALVESVSSKFSIAQDFYKLKAQLFGVDKLAYHERAVPYGAVTKEYSYEEAVAIIARVFKKLDVDFFNLFKMFVDEELIDVYPKKGKRSGAFCVHFLQSEPTYIMLNHTNKLRDVTTLAHELGHAINNEMMKQKQHSLDFDTTLATAEVASTFMEDFVFEELLKNASDEERLSLLVQKLDDDIATIMRQIACYQFEQALHKAYREKGHLAKEDIGAIFQQHMDAYMGPGVEQSKGSENWWVHWPHIRSFFYVYSYSSGLLISKALQRKVRSDPAAISSVKQFLSAGTSKSPKDIFLDAGIDITKKEFWDAGIAEVKDLLEETKTLAQKLGKI